MCLSLPSLQGLVESLQKAPRTNEGSDTILQDLVLYRLLELLDLLTVVEGATELLVDRLIHPPLLLSATIVLKVATLLSRLAKLIDHVKDLLDTYPLQSRVGHNLRLPARLGRGKEL